MKKIVVNDVSLVAEEMISVAEDGGIACGVFFYEEAVELMTALMCFIGVEAEDIRITQPSFNRYNKEYYVTIDQDFRVCVEPAWSDKNEYHEAGYLTAGADVVYIDGEAKSNIISCFDGDPEIIEVELSDQCPCQCEHCGGDYSFEYTIETTYDIDVYKEDDGEDDEVVEFIERRFPSAETWREGNCYYLALILSDRFPDGEIVYDVIEGHFMFRRGGKYYDHSGVVFPDGYIVAWDKFDAYDDIQKKRIVRDCLL